MIKRLDSAVEYMDFINEVNADPCFCDPMLSSEELIKCNLLAAPHLSNRQLFGVFEGDKIIGLFVFLVLKDESYAEMLVGLSREETAYSELFSFLKENLMGFISDFVFNPRNYILHKALQAVNAQFETEQQKMILKNETAFKSNLQIELYSEKYKKQYIEMHSEDVYWTAEKVINAPDVFRIILAVDGDEVVGYIDITHKNDENEPFDIFVKESHRNRGFGKAMLAKAIELNKPHGLSLLVDIDNSAAIAMYRSMGFVEVMGENSLTAHIVF